MKIYKYSMRIYKYSMRFRVPALDQSDCRICYNYDLNQVLFLVYRLRKSLMSFGPLDFKCKDGCWYCEDRCHHCLQPATVGYSLRTVERQILKFCKVNPCYSFYVPLPESPPTFILPLPHASSDSSDSELLIQIVKVISTGWSSKTVAIVHLCIVPGTNKRQLYVLTHFRTAGSHAFFDFLISENYEPLNTMWYMKHKHSIIMSNRALFMLMIKMIVEDALQATSYQNLQGLLSAHQVAALTDTKKEHCQPDTNKSEKDTFTGENPCKCVQDLAPVHVCLGGGGEFNCNYDTHTAEAHLNN